MSQQTATTPGQDAREFYGRRKPPVPGTPRAEATVHQMAFQPRFTVTPPHARLRRIPIARACERCTAWTPNGGGCVGQSPGPGTTLPACYVWPDGSMLQPIEHGADGPRLIAGQEAFWQLRVDADGVAWADPIVESDAWRALQKQRGHRGHKESRGGAS